MSNAGMKIKGWWAMVSLTVAVIVFGGTDVFGQRFGRLRTVAVGPVKAEIILESNSSAQQEWKLEERKRANPAHEELESAEVPGAPTVVSWNFGELKKSAAGSYAKFQFTFVDSDSEIKTGFVFYPREGKILFKYNQGAGLDWDFDESRSSTARTPTKKTFASPRGEVGGDTTEVWTLEQVLGNRKEEGVAVFKFNFRGDDITEIKVKLRK